MTGLHLEKNGGQGRNRTTDTRIFSRGKDRLRLYISKGYRGVRCLICITMQDCAQLIHAKLTHTSYIRQRFFAAEKTTPHDSSEFGHIFVRPKGLEFKHTKSRVGGAANDLIRENIRTTAMDSTSVVAASWWSAFRFRTRGRSAASDHFWRRYQLLQVATETGTGRCSSFCARNHTNC